MKAHWHCLRLVCLFWCLVAVDQCAASVAVAPANMAVSDSAFGSGTLTHASRIQEVFGAVNFPTGGLIITEIRFRPDYNYGRAFTTTVANLEIRLSTTGASADGLSPTFAQNVGLDETVVFSGPLSISSRFSGPPTGPKDFDITIPLTTPFVYGPGLGNLLVDIRNFSGSTASLLSGQNRSDDSASRLIGANVSSATGSRDSGIDALEVVYTPTNGPPSPPPPPPNLTRGPYLQCGTTTNIIVRWRTSQATDGRVLFGLAANELAWEVSTPGLVTEHVLTLTNLASDTRYYYGIGTSETNLASGTNYTFLTAPFGAKPTRIWAIGDSGSAGQPGYEGMAASVRDAYTAFTGTRPTDVWLMLGDNAYLSGTDEEFQSALFDVYPTMLRRFPVWPTLGNHDVTMIGGDYAQLNIFSYVTQGEAGGIASGSKHYYSFNYGNVHFVCLDSEDSDRNAGGAMLTWLEQDLSANTNDWLIAFWHRPPYSFGTHNSDTEGNMVDMRQNAVPILEAHGVDLVLTGHSHNYERSHLIDGHYGSSSTLTRSMVKDCGSGRPGETGAYLKDALGPNPHQGAVYVVAGSSGWVTADGGWGQHPVMFTKIRELGSMVVDVNSNRLDAKFLRESGAIPDSFTIIKSAQAEPLRWATFNTANGVVTAQWKSIAGHSYRVEGSSDLDPNNWLPASATITAYGATAGWTNSIPAGAPQVFYRVVKLD